MFCIRGFLQQKPYSTKSPAVSHSAEIFCPTEEQDKCHVFILWQRSILCSSHLRIKLLSNKSHSTEMTKTYFSTTQLHKNSRWHGCVQRAGQALLCREGFECYSSINIPTRPRENTAPQKNNHSCIEGDTSRPTSDVSWQAQGLIRGHKGGRSFCMARRSSQSRSLLRAAFCFSHRQPRGETSSAAPEHLRQLRWSGNDLHHCKFGVKG